MFLINPYILQASGGSYILDTYGSAKVAYSLHQLSSTATLACRVRRSSDNAEQDIGFVAGDLDTTSLLSFVGAGDGFVVKMYDQSGNANDVFNSTGGDQRYIVQSGVLNLYPSSSIVTTYRQSVNSYLNLTTPFLQTSEHTTVSVGNTTLGEFNGVNGNNAPISVGTTTSKTLRYFDTTSNNFGTLTGGNHITGTYRKLDNTIRAFDNGVLFGSSLTGSTLSASNYIKIWDRLSNANYYSSTVILWENDLSANSIDISTELNNYYGFY